MLPDGITLLSGGCIKSAPKPLRKKLLIPCFIPQFNIHFRVIGIVKYIKIRINTLNRVFHSQIVGHQGGSVMAIEEVKRIDDYKGHQMIQVGNTRISLAKAMRMVENAEAIKALAQSDGGQATAPQPTADNPFLGGAQ